MGFLKAFGKLFKWRRQMATPADISRVNIDQADAIIDFAASKEWPQYQDYIERKMTRAIEESFSLLDTDKDGALRAKLAEAKAYYAFLRDLDNSYFVIKQQQDRVNKPLTP